MLDFNENEIHFSGPAWFVGPKDRPDDISHLCRVISRLSKDDRSCVAIFSDKDGAQRFIDWQRKTEDLALQQSPFCCETKQNLLDLLTILAGMGITHVGIDPEKGRPIKRAPIADFFNDAFDGTGSVVFDS